MTDAQLPALTALAAAAGVDPLIFTEPAVAAYFEDIALAVAMLGDVAPADPDADAPFDPAWPNGMLPDGNPS